MRADRLVAILVLVPGGLAGCGLSTTLLAAHDPGAIVVEVVRMDFTTGLSADGAAKHRASQTTITTITRSSGSGEDQNVFSTDSLTRPGYQQAQAGDSLQLYDPTDDTIYETTERAWESAVTRQMDRNEPKGTRSTSAYLSFSYDVGPGRRSVFEQQLRAHLYKQAGRTEVNGRAALKLVPTRRSIRLSPHSGAHELLGTVYVTPGTYDPIKEVIGSPDFGPGSSSTLVENWLVYKVLPATPTNLRLVSLTARHPGARIVHGGGAYIRAQATESRRSLLIRPTAN